MGKFVFGVIVGIVAVFGGAYAYVHYGFFNMRADQARGTVERIYMRGAMDRYAERYAANQKNPLTADEATLIAGVKLYKNDCALCHGGPSNPISDVGQGLNPRAPQFLKDAPDLPEYQNFWIIKHGIRMTGMPAWEKVLTDSEIWQLTTFLTKFEQIDKLPPAVQAEWKKPTAP
jgi:thiosulfate dehydrogenase